MNARLYVLWVANPKRFLTKEERLHIEACEKLCKEFGGRFLRESSYDIAKTMIEVANTKKDSRHILTTPK
jgi:two-component system sensor histidine kinase KdpD